MQGTIPANYPDIPISLPSIAEDGLGVVSIVIVVVVSAVLEQLLPSRAIVRPLSHCSQTVLDSGQFTQPSTWQSATGIKKNITMST